MKMPFSSILCLNIPFNLKFDWQKILFNDIFPNIFCQNQFLKIFSASLTRGIYHFFHLCQWLPGITEFPVRANVLRGEATAEKKQVGAELSWTYNTGGRGRDTKGNQNITILAKRSHIQSWLCTYNPFDITAKLNKGQENQTRLGLQCQTPLNF